MKLLELKNVSRIYKNGKTTKTAISHVNLSFPSSGLISIVGKSGSGKSTLINMLTMFDSPSEGEVFFNGESTKKWNDKKVNLFRNENIGIISQSYNLLENENVLFNIALPMMIKGAKDEHAISDAITLLETINYPKNLYYQRVADLSGGEKERTAILRSLINNPQIIFADEPTGALDSNNTKIVMNLLKKISEKKLVIMVSHNNKMVEKYSDRIIEICDGKIVKDRTITEDENGIPLVKNKTKKYGKKWINKIVSSNFKNRIKRNSIACASLTIGILSTLLITGFTYNAKNEIKSTNKMHLDYGVLTISKDKVIEKADNGLKIVQSERPQIDELSKENEIMENFYLFPNYDFFVPSSIQISFENQSIDKILYSPILSFDSEYIDSSLLIDGKLPNNGLINECLVNKEAYKMLKSLDYHLGENLLVQNSFIYEYQSDGLLVEQNFDFKQTIKIIGVVDELNFLSTPKIYYSYSELDYLFENEKPSEICDALGYEMNWKEIVMSAGSHDIITSYSYRLFSKNINQKSIDIKLNNDELIITSNALIIGDALLEIINATTMGMWVFLMIAIVGSILILSIVSFAAYNDDRKQLAILLSLGAGKADISDIYLTESIYIGIFGLVFGVILSVILQPIINATISVTTGFDSLVKIPWKNFLGIDFIFPMLILTIILAISILTTIVPMKMAKRISIKEELSFE